MKFEKRKDKEILTLNLEEILQGIEDDIKK